MDNVVVINLKSVIMHAEVYLERFARNYPELGERILYNRNKRANLREYIYNRFWNIINVTTKYKYDELEEDIFLEKIFEGWTQKNWFRDDAKEVVITEEGSFRFNAEWVIELDTYFDALIRQNKIYIGWKLVEFDISESTLSIDIFGDWRAKEWCEQNNAEYRPI